MWLFGKKTKGGRADDDREAHEAHEAHEAREARLGEELRELRELPPDQRRRRLQQRLEETERELRLDHDQRVALLKMRDVYSDTPSLGDASSLEPQLAEVQARSRALTHARRRLQQLLAETEGRDPQPHRRTQRRSMRPSQPLPPTQRSGDVAGDLRAAGRAGDSEDDSEDEFDDEFDDEEDEAAPPAASQCRALYSFTADSEDSLSVVEGEILFVVTGDGGDGWTRVRRGSDEGYVPTSYIELHAGTATSGTATSGTTGTGTTSGGGGTGDAAITYI